MNMVGGTSKAGERVGKIAAVSREQAQGIGQISAAVAQMGKVVQKNAAFAEASASASQLMSVQADRMRGSVQDLTKRVEGSRDR